MPSITEPQPNGPNGCARAIYALKNGRVEQSGNPDEVYRQGGIYKDIVDASARSLNIDKLASQIGVTAD